MKLEYMFIYMTLYVHWIVIKYDKTDSRQDMLAATSARFANLFLTANYTWFNSFALEEDVSHLLM